MSPNLHGWGDQKQFYNSILGAQSCIWGIFFCERNDQGDHCKREELWDAHPRPHHLETLTIVHFITFRSPHKFSPILDSNYQAQHRQPSTIMCIENLVDYYNVYHG